MRPPARLRGGLDVPGSPSRLPGRAWILQQGAKALLALLLPGILHAQEASTRELVDAVRRGGTTVVCRHAITRDEQETEPVSYEDPSTQRLLSEEGERQSRRMGQAFRALGIGFAEVVASPMQRARRTASLFDAGPLRIDSIWHTNGGSYQGPDRSRRLQALAEPAPGNRIVVSHVVTMTSVLPDAEGRLGEGDCAVVRPSGDDFRFLGVVPWEGWLEAADLDARRDRPRARPGSASTLLSQLEPFPATTPRALSRDARRVEPSIPIGEERRREGR